MKTALFKIIITSLILLSCSQSKNDKTQRDNEPDVYNLEDSDTGINNAIAKANETLNQFETILKNDDQHLNYYSIKQSFPTSNGGGENIWVGQIKLVKGNYSGIIGNEPIYTKAVKLGETITVDKSKISDWMIIDGTTGKTKGGYTIRVLRDRMSTEEKKQFDLSSGLVFE